MSASHSSPKNPRAVSSELARVFSREGLGGALSLLASRLGAFGRVDRLYCYAHDARSGMFLGLAEHPSGEGAPARAVSRLRYDDEMPVSLRLQPSGGDTLIVNQEEALADCPLPELHRYAIRQELFHDGDAACLLGILTDDEALCHAGVGNWLRECTARMASMLRESLDLAAVFSSSVFEDAPARLRACPKLSDVMRQVERAARSGAPTLIQGETGVGKELVAESIHQLSAFRGGPFVAVNCGAIPEGLADSLFFGHEKGAFTGAAGRAAGYFEQAQGGTLFLDEIGELSLGSQARLLRVLERRAVQRVGGTDSLPLRLRILAATNRDLEDRADQGLFRPDLLYRLNALAIHVPPLRERAQDIVALTNHFLARKAAEYGFAEPPVLPRRELDKLFAWRWPGNVRELENVLERAFLHLLDMPEHSPLEVEIPSRRQRRAPVGSYRLSGAEASSTAASCQENELVEGDMSLESVIQTHIRRVMRRTAGRIYGPDGAAALLGVHPNTLRSRLDRMGWTRDALFQP